MKKRKLIQTTLLGMTCLAGLSSVSAAETKRGADFVGEPVHPAQIKVNVRGLNNTPQWQPGDPIKEIPMRFRRPKDWERPEAMPRGFGLDPLALKQQAVDATGTAFGSGADFNTPIVNVDGSAFTGSNPADTNGDVGINYYIQSVNGGPPAGSNIFVINKNDGSLEAQFALESLAAGSGTGCTSGSGDPVILFDQNVDNGPGQPRGRWVLTEFTQTSLCIYVSATYSPFDLDPNDGDDVVWYLYEFTSETGGLPDYPKFGVWPDAYYMGANESNRQYAFDRENMLNGDTARGYQVFQTVGLPGFGFQHLMPADADGVIEPPVGAPGIFMRHRDSEYHGDAGGDDVLEIWEFSTDWDTPANSAITGPINVVVSEFDTNLGGTNFGDLSVPQPDGATNLFPLKQPLMWRVQHRTIDSKQYLVGNMVTDVNGNDYHGVRWWILERPVATTSGGWTVSDEGTYTSGDGVNSGDGVHRWMASAAMDSSGNLAIGYNTSAVTGNNNAAADVYAGMRYAGRLKDDPAGTLPRGEVSIIEGSASNASFRYGDYTSLSVDPIDDCTFWYTAQYNQNTNWSTRIASFRYDQCGDPAIAITSSNPSQAICSGDDVSFDLNVIGLGQYDGVVTLTDGGDNVGTNAFTVNPIPSLPGSSTLNITSTGGTTAGNYTINVLATSPTVDDKNIDLMVQVFEEAATDPTLIAPADGAVNQDAQPNLSWSDVGALSYTVEIATDADFNDIVFTGTNSNATIAPTTDLESSTVYFWRVKANNSCGESNFSPVFSFTTIAAPGDCSLDQTAVVQYEYGFENGLDVWTADSLIGGSDLWAISSDNVGTGTNSAHAVDVGNVSDQVLISPAIQLPTDEFPLSLSFWNLVLIEQDGTNGCYDSGILEISTDDGLNFNQIDNSLLLTQPYTGPTAGGFSHPLPGGTQAWCGDPPQEPMVSVVNLNDYAGEEVRFRFRLSSDSSASRDGWFVDDVKVQSCVSNGQESYTIGGEVSGLAPGNEVVLDNILSEQLTVSANGPFTFPTEQFDGGPYNVTVITQPTSPDQVCEVTNGSGVVPDADVTDISVVCETVCDEAPPENDADIIWFNGFQCVQEVNN